jgi:hypothetical protein
VRIALLAAALALVALPGVAHAADDGGRIEARYQALGGAAGALGAPTSEPYDVGADGRARDFAAGRIYWSPATDAWEVLPPLLDRYLALAGPDGYLGFPAAPAAALPSAEGGLEQVFTGGRVYASAATGARAVSGAILKRYLAIGATESYLGFLRRDMTATADGYVARFQRGRITWSDARRTTTVKGSWAPSVLRVTAEEIPYTYRSGCPVGPSSLRMVRMPYHDWRGVPQHGRLVARSTAVADLKLVFRQAFAARFPIRRMNPADVYQGSDVRAMAADSTSAFNCRKVTGNPYRLSQHSYGNAIDINTVENPYVTSSRVYPRTGRTFLNRSKARKGMILRRGPVARAMARQGWRWGARWAHPDYQHFSSNGG